MFFYLSKIFAFLLAPANWVLLGFIFYWFTKNPKRKKTILIITLSLTFILTNSFIYEKVVLWWQTPRTVMIPGRQYDAGILLGGMYSFDDDKQGYFNDCCDRFIETNKLYQSGIIKKIIISGGSAAILIKEPSEADSLKKEFMQSGVKEQDIIIEPHSRNTYENALYTKRITDSLHLKPPFALITSAFHIPRAMRVFKKQNMAVVAVPSNYIAIKRGISPEQYILPNVTLLNYWGTIFKEWIGIMMYSLSGKA